MDTWTTYTFFGALALLLLLQSVRPGRRFRPQRFWRLRGVLMFAMASYVGAVAPMLWDEWLYAHQLWDARALGTWGGALAGFFAYQVISYFWHRTMHRVPWLFRWIHQTHHSVERMDLWGAFYFHPFDVAGFALMASLAMVLVVGVTVEAALVAGVALNLVAAFGHTNLRTPAWLGYLVARPEQHALHHQRGVHAYNYADLPVIDLLFGTFKNPPTWEAEAGYHDGASLRLGAMLLGRDVTQPKSVGVEVAQHTRADLVTGVEAHRRL